MHDYDARTRTAEQSAVKMKMNQEMGNIAYHDNAR